MRSQAFTRWILGPVGSGKSTGCLMELMRRAAEQAPGPDGYRRTRFAIVRNTLQQLRQTVLKEIETWLTPILRWRVTDNTVFLEAGDIRSEWFLIPLEDPQDQRRLLSLQLTGVWINEFSETDPSLIPAMAGRCGRYPSAAMGGASWFGIVGDSNMPTIGGEWHRLLDLDRPADWDVHIQPSGLSVDAAGIPNAENLNWLLQTPHTLQLPLNHPDRLRQGYTYYTRLSGQNGADWVKRYVLAQYGDDPSGTAVFRGSFRSYRPNGEAWHVQKNLSPVHGQTLWVGQDFGRNPCAVLGQLDHRGRMLILEEIISEDMGLERHISENLRPRIGAERYAGLRVVVVGDPSGNARSTFGEESCFDLLKRRGFAAYPGVTNDIDPRLRGVEALLLGSVETGPAFMVDGERCPTLVRALGGSYRYAKTKAGQTKPLPEKLHPWSDIADALQYLCGMGDEGYRGRVMRKLNPAPVARREKMDARGWT